MRREVVIISIGDALAILPKEGHLIVSRDSCSCHNLMKRVSAGF